MHISIQDDDAFGHEFKVLSILILATELKLRRRKKIISLSQVFSNFIPET
jgi:hypothetical protein